VGETIGKHFERKGVASRPHRSRRERTGARPRVARECHSAVRSSPKTVHESRDRDCNGHRILRRVPTDGRYSGSSRRVGFHETAIVVVLAISILSDPHPRPKARGAARLQHKRKLVRRRAIQRSRQECQRLDCISAVGRKRPCSPSKAVRLRARWQSAKAVFGCREASGPPVMPCGA